MNMYRVWVLATNGFREVFRDRALYFAGLFGIVFVLAVLLLSELSAGAENKIVLDVGIAMIGLFGLVVAAFIGPGLINKEIEKRTVLVLLAKPMSRSEFILGKHLGLTGVLIALVTLMSAIYFIVMSLKQFDYPAGSLAIAMVYLCLELSLLTAAALLFGVFTSSLIASLLTLALYFMGHLSQNLVTLSQSIESLTLQRLIKGIYLVFPDLSRLDLKNQAVYSLLPEPSVLLTNALYGVLYTLVLLAIATMIFSRRQF